MTIPASTFARALVLVVAAANIDVAGGCSDFLLNASSPDIVVSARTMDFVADLKTVIEVIPRNTTFQELPVRGCPECPDFAWRNPLGFVAFNMFGLNVATDGLNEKGLSAAWLYLDKDSTYPKADRTSSKPIVTSVPSYILGNFATVDDVRKGIEGIQIAEIDERTQAAILGSTEQLSRLLLHVAVHDASGKNLVIEFLDGQVMLYDNPNGVLTNEPPLDEQLKELAKNGMENLPGDYSPISRFTRLSVLNRDGPLGYSNASTNASYLTGTPTQQAVSTALHYINTVVQPKGVATQWTVVRDHRQRVLYFESTQNQLLRRVNLSEFDFARSDSRQYVSSDIGEWFVDVSKSLKRTSERSMTMDLPPRTQLQKITAQIVGNVSNEDVGDSPAPPKSSIRSETPDQAIGTLLWAMMSSLVVLSTL